MSARVSLFLTLAMTELTRAGRENIAAPTEHTAKRFTRAIETALRTPGADVTVIRGVLRDLNEGS